MPALNGFGAQSRMKNVKRIMILCCALAACTPRAEFSVVAAERFWGGAGPDGVMFTASILTLQVTRSGSSPLTADDLSSALSAARAHCAARGLIFAGEGADIETGLPSFADNTWELAGRCEAPVAAL